MISRRSILSLAHSGLAAQSASPRIPLLNHFYATVNPKTYAAIEASTYLREQFAPFEKRTTVRNDSTYSGLYFYGDETYFEFFEENQGDRKPGDAGIALGIETAGGSQWLRNQWNQLRPSITATVTRQLDQSPIDWFQMTSFEESRAKSLVEGLRLFSMEYVPDFARRWNPSGENSIAQRTILTAYCARLGLLNMRNSSLLKNVREVEIEAPEESVKVRAAQIEAAGWKVKSSRQSAHCTGPNANIIFRYAPKPLGVALIRFEMKRKSIPQSLQIGDTFLELLKGGQAIWRLRA